MITIVLILIGIVIWLILETMYETRPPLEKAKEYVSNLVRENETHSFFKIMDDAKMKFSLTEDEVSLLALHLMNILKKD